MDLTPPLRARRLGDDAEPTLPVTTAETEPALRTGHPRKIRCPKCTWEPTAADRWWCTCGHTWNTFDTGGRCPGCHRQWLETQCRLCDEWSPHEQWYERAAN